MRRDSGLTLVEVAAASGLLALTTLGFASAMTGSIALDGQTRERSCARIAAQKELDAVSALGAQDLVALAAAPRDFAVGAGSERLLAAPVPGETPPRTVAGRVTVDATYPGVAQAVVSVRWRSASGPLELRLRADVALER